MILGRSPALWLSLIAAGLNVLIIVGGVHLTDVEVATLNAFFVALVGIIANESDPTTAGTFAMTTSRPALVSIPIGMTPPASPTAVGAPIAVGGPGPGNPTSPGTPDGG